jgi:hypothetical protein
MPYYYSSEQGRRKHKKIGGGAFARGTFGMKRAPENFSGNVGDGDCNHTKCNLNNIFHEGKGHFATGEWAFFVFSEGKIIAIIKKCNLNLNNIFHEGKGHFATGERALFVFSENLGGGALAPLFSAIKIL